MRPIWTKLRGGDILHSYKYFILNLCSGFIIFYTIYIYLFSSKVRFKVFKKLYSIIQTMFNQILPIQNKTLYISLANIWLTNNVIKFRIITTLCKFY